jgi:hypothetical protein
VLIVTRNFELGAVLLIGGSVALAYSLAMLLYADWLNDDRVVMIEPWRATEPCERPAGMGGRRWARNCMNELVLRFAKAASAVAIALLASALAAASQQ